MIEQHQHQVTPALVLTKVGLHALAFVVLEAANVAIDEAKAAIRLGRGLTEMAAVFRASADWLDPAYDGASATPTGDDPPCKCHEEDRAGEYDNPWTEAMEEALRATLAGNAPPADGPTPNGSDDASRDDHGLHVAREGAALDAIADAARKGSWTTLARLLTRSERAGLARALFGGGAGREEAV